MDHTHTTTGNDQGRFLQTAEDRMEASLSWPYQLAVEVYPAKMVLPKQKTPQVWATNLCRRVMFLALNWWQIRNEVYHDRVSKYSYLRDREVLIAEVSARFEIIQPDHPAVNRLFSNSLDQLITSTNSSMQAWMTSYDLITKFLRPHLITSYLGT